MHDPKRPASLLSTVIRSAAERMAHSLAVPPENRQAFRDTAEAIMFTSWADLFGGERVRLRVYVPRASAAARQARRDRIVRALAAGEPKATIAARERVSLRWVEKLAATRTE